MGKGVGLVVVFRDALSAAVPPAERGEVAETGEGPGSRGGA